MQNTIFKKITTKLAMETTINNHNINSYNWSYYIVIARDGHVQKLKCCMYMFWIIRIRINGVWICEGLLYSKSQTYLIIIVNHTSVFYLSILTDYMYMGGYHAWVEICTGNCFFLWLKIKAAVV